MLNLYPMLRAERLPPITKWAGGKEQELNFILPNIPQQFDRFIEPFVGGGAVFFSINSSKMLINDFSNELVSLYKFVQEGNLNFFNYLYTIEKQWRTLEMIIGNNKVELLNLYKIFSTSEISNSQHKDYIVSFVLNHIDDFNGIISPTFNINLENFCKKFFVTLLAKQKE